MDVRYEGEFVGGPWDGKRQAVLAPEGAKSFQVKMMPKRSIIEKIPKDQPIPYVTIDIAIEVSMDATKPPYRFVFPPGSTDQRDWGNVEP